MNQFFDEIKFKKITKSILVLEEENIVKKRSNREMEEKVRSIVITEVNKR